MKRTSIYLVLFSIFLVFISCAEEFKIIRHGNNSSDYLTINSTFIEAKVSSMADIYYYKIYLSPTFISNKGEETYIFNMKHLGISYLNLESAWLEINGNKVELIETHLPIRKQEGTSHLAEIHAFQISKENFKALIEENDSRMFLKSGQLTIDVFFEKEIKEKLLQFFNETLNSR